MGKKNPNSKPSGNAPAPESNLVEELMSLPVKIEKELEEKERLESAKNRLKIGTDMTLEDFKEELGPVGHLDEAKKAREAIDKVFDVPGFRIGPTDSLDDVKQQIETNVKVKAGADKSDLENFFGDIKGDNLDAHLKSFFVAGVLAKIKTGLKAREEYFKEWMKKDKSRKDKKLGFVVAFEAGKNEGKVEFYPKDFEEHFESQTDPEKVSAAEANERMYGKEKLGIKENLAISFLGGNTPDENDMTFLDRVRENRTTLSDNIIIMILGIFGVKGRIGEMYSELKESVPENKRRMFDVAEKRFGGPEKKDDKKTPGESGEGEVVEVVTVSNNAMKGAIDDGEWDFDDSGEKMSEDLSIKDDLAADKLRIEVLADNGQVTLPRGTVVKDVGSGDETTLSDDVSFGRADGAKEISGKLLRDTVLKGKIKFETV